MAEIRKINIKPGETIQITCEENEAVQTTPTPPNSGGETDTKDRGELKYKVALMGDCHIKVDGDKAEAEADLINALDYFRKVGVDFISNLGDIGEYDDEDYERFREIYTAHVWAPTNAMMRMFMALGNHDYWKLYTNGSNIAKLLPQTEAATESELSIGISSSTDSVQRSTGDCSGGKGKCLSIPD